MTNLAIFVALGWFWLTFYGVGPLTSWSQVAVGGLSLVLGCAAFALWGAVMVARRRPRRTVRPASPAPAGRAAPRR